MDKELIKELFTYEYLIKDITENIDSYNQQIKELIVFNNTHNQIISLKENYDNYVRNNAPATYNKLPDISDTTKEKIDKLFEVKISPIKEPKKDLLKDEINILSIFFDDPKKRILAKSINNHINKIPNIDEQKNLRKYISMLIIKKINLNHEYFKKLDKWVIQALCVDDLMKRQHLRDFIQENKKALEYLVS